MSNLAEKSVETSMRKCLSCGANMVFDPDKQKLYCSHCETTQDLNFNVKAREINVQSAFDEEVFSLNSTLENVFTCDNCGAKVFFSENQSAKSCPFCGTSHVTKTGQLKGVKPNAVIPFSFGTNRALDFAKKWAKRSFFAPSAFKKSLNAQGLSGVYVPSFTFDSATTSTYQGKVGYRRTRTVGYGKNRRTETYIEWRFISGTFYRNYDDILISSGEKIDQTKLNKLSPYYTGESCQYEDNFLLGFSAYHYDKSIIDCWDSARAVMDSDIKRGIIAEYYADVVSYINVDTVHENVTFKYVLLPVYTGNFKYSKKNYNFYINGRTGRVFGKRPVSALKILLTILFSAGILTGITFLLRLAGVF